MALEEGQTLPIANPTARSGRLCPPYRAANQNATRRFRP